MLYPTDMMLLPIAIATHTMLTTLKQGLKIARKLLLDINGMGVPAGTEFLDTITPNFIADTISWAAIGGCCVRLTSPT